MIPLFWHYSIYDFLKTMLVNTKQQNNEETDNSSSTWPVTDDLFVQSTLPPATKHIQVTELNYKKWNLRKNSQAVILKICHYPTITATSGPHLFLQIGCFCVDLYFTMCELHSNVGIYTSYDFGISIQCWFSYILQYGHVGILQCGNYSSMLVFKYLTL